MENEKKENENKEKRKMKKRKWVQSEKGKGKNGKWEKRKYENENRKEKIVFLDGLHTNDEKWGRKKFIKREDAHQYFPLRPPSASSMIAI